MTSNERESLPVNQAREVVRKLLIKLSSPRSSFGEIRQYYLNTLKEVTGKEKTNLSSSEQLGFWFAVLFAGGSFANNVNKTAGILTQEFALKRQMDEPTPDETLKLIFAEVAKRMSQSDRSTILEQDSEMTQPDIQE